MINKIGLTDEPRLNGGSDWTQAVQPSFLEKEEIWQSKSIKQD